MALCRYHVGELCIRHFRSSWPPSLLLHFSAGGRSVNHARQVLNPTLPCDITALPVIHAVRSPRITSILRAVYDMLRSDLLVRATLSIHLQTYSCLSQT